jgi:hypothetical protein
MSLAPPAAPFCEMLASDTDALQFGSPITRLGAVLALAKGEGLGVQRHWRELILAVSTDDRKKRVRFPSVILLMR